MTILEQLHQDHINLSRLLEVLEMKIQKLKEGDSPNFQLLSELVEYIGNYADQSHHPREDHMYHYFELRDTNLDKDLKACEAQHVDLKQLSREVTETVDAVMHDAVIPMAEFIQRLENFVQRERAHINFEEQAIFPKINAISTADDWKELEKNLPQHEDPLFGEKQGENYREIYKAMIQEVSAV